MAFFEPCINMDTAAFWEGCRNHELRFQRCRNCGKIRWPGAYLCPNCLSRETDLCVLPPEGEIYSYVVMRKPFHPSMADKIPYVVATVDLSEDIRILANMAQNDAEGIHCGARVTIEFEDSETYSRPVARLKEGAK